MLLETSSPLIVAPILGHSVAIWATMICLSIGSLALGYFLGGYLSKKDLSESFVVRLFAINALLLCTGLIILHLQNHSSMDLSDSFYCWLIVGIVLCLPIILFGASTPLIVSILHNKLKADKSVVGRLYSISTVGGVLFSLITGYWFIPNLGVSTSIFIALLVTSIIPLLFYIREKNHKFAGLVGVAVVTAFVLGKMQKELPESSDFTVQHFSESINGQLIVTDFEVDGRTNRLLFINRMGQTWIDLETKNSSWPYVNAITCIGNIYPSGSKSLVLGLGGGILPIQLNGYLGHRVDAVEIDQRIIDVSEEFFGLQGVNPICDDARRYVKTTENRYNLVVMDIFNGEIMPSHGLSKESFEDTKKILKQGGMLVINFNGFIEGKEGLPARCLMKTLEAAGFKFKVFDANAGKSAVDNRNMLYLAYVKEPNWTKAFPLTFGPEEHIIADHLIDPKELYYSDGFVISDDKPIMEFINRHAAERWRKTYTKNFTKKFKKTHSLPFVQ